MIIAFGRKTSPMVVKPFVYSNKIYILNTETYSWVSSFNEVSQGAPTNNNGISTNQGNLPTDNGNSSTYKIILYVVISIGCIAFLSVLVVFYKKCYKNRTELEKILIAGDSDNSDLHDKERHSNIVI
ncbi:hypothetical protein C2G38_2075425 [Gigaspora rosea]|uniref:Uncharacterized protein n=1 Tax=Gigaspora rosea TaxID=44941 RepID=A0A397VJ61_9GLOM|nr:hypothetical protein C2G38_2075425 [Gigaspora rosea]